MASAAVLSLSSTQISTKHPHSSPSHAIIRRENVFNLRTNIRKASALVQASPKFQTQRGDEEESKAPDEKPPFISQEDLNYVLKLGGGSVVGAGAIKYGSIVFPEMTRPNIGEAMVMISAPVLLAVLLLIFYSRPPMRRTED